MAHDIIDPADRFDANNPGPCLLYEDVAVSANAVGLAEAAWAGSALIHVDGADVRARFDGGNPVGGGAGQLVLSGQQIVVTTNHDLQAARFVRNAAVDATLRVHYFA